MTAPLPVSPPDAVSAQGPNAAAVAPVVLRLPTVLRELVGGAREVSVTPRPAAGPDTSSSSGSSGSSGLPRPSDSSGSSGASYKEGQPEALASTLGDVLDAVAERWPILGRRVRDETGALRRYVNVYVNGEDVRGAAGLATPVAGGAVVEVLPSIAGG